MSDSKKDLGFCPCCGYKWAVVEDHPCSFCSAPMVLTGLGDEWPSFTYNQKINKINETRNKIVKESPLFDMDKWNERARREQDFDYVKKIGDDFVRTQEVDTLTRNIVPVNNPVQCARCGSQQIHAEKRGWKLLTGFLGSSKIIITCLNCGYQWRAGDR